MELGCPRRRNTWSTIRTLSPPRSTADMALRAAAVLALALATHRAAALCGPAVHPRTRALRSGTVARPAEVSHTSEIVVAHDVATAYALFTDLEKQPLWSPWLRSVKVTSDLESLWTIGIGAARISWRAEITERDRDRAIAWESRSGLRNKGRCTFAPTSERRAVRRAEPAAALGKRRRAARWLRRRAGRAAPAPAPAPVPVPAADDDAVPGTAEDATQLALTVTYDAPAWLAKMLAGSARLDTFVQATLQADLVRFGLELDARRLGE